MKKICVFCGSNSGDHPAYLEAARLLGRTLAENNLSLVYGGSDVGLMGALANAALKAKGQVIGVIPKILVDKEVAHKNLADLRIVNSMHERKALMAELSDGFIALPGGFGTLEEFCEILTWAQLGLHQKPLGLLNVNNYYKSLLEFFDHTTREGFVHSGVRKLVLQAETPTDLIKSFRNYKPVDVKKWLHRTSQT